MYHDNTTKSAEKIGKPVTGFTHVYTPNDYAISDDEALELYHDVRYIGQLMILKVLKKSNNPNEVESISKPH